MTACGSSGGGSSSGTTSGTSPSTVSTSGSTPASPSSVPSSSSGGGGASAPGVTADTVTIGLLTALTGPAASTFADVPKGAEARVDLLNDNGGINGRKIKLEVADDQGSPNGNLAAAKSLVEQKHAFLVVSESPFTFGSAKYLHDAGVPVVGGSYDG